MQVDDEFVLAVRDKSGESRCEKKIIAATLAVAAERGLVVPDDASKGWAVAESGGKPHPGMVFNHRASAWTYAPKGTAVVRVAVVEIKE